MVNKNIKSSIYGDKIEYNKCKVILSHFQLLICQSHEYSNGKHNFLDSYKYD